MDKLVAALRRRVDPSGVLGVKIRAYGSRQIEIKVPQLDQEQVNRLKRLLASVGSLEFRILATDRRAQYKSYIQRAKALPPEQTELKDDEGKPWLAWWVPVAEEKDAEFRNVNYGTRYTTDRKGVNHLEVLVVNDSYDVTGEYLNRAFPSTDNQGKPCVAFVFNSIGAQKFSRLTGIHLPDPDQHFYYHLGIILDKKLVTAPRLKSAISDRGEISGGFDAEKAKELVDVLNAGALPAALSPQPISERTTGPELGQDTIQRGKLSMVVSLGAVFLSVLVYYRFAGIVACTALAMNAILLLASMIIINAEFSLAGIAGFALSIGMAVDANVLIYERMREEAGRGAALRMTIRNGFERALTAIVDSNLTTLITAVILYAIGTDQVRGFAVTLFLGIVLSMYTAIIVARVIFDVAERQRWIDKVKMMRALPPTRFDFLRYKWVAIAISVSIICIGLVATFARGRGILDIDFTGGVSVETVFKGTRGPRTSRRSARCAKRWTGARVGQRPATRREPRSKRDDVGRGLGCVPEKPAAPSVGRPSARCAAVGRGVGRRRQADRGPGEDCYRRPPSRRDGEGDHPDRRRRTRQGKDVHHRRLQSLRRECRGIPRAGEAEAQEHLWR